MALFSVTGDALGSSLTAIAEAFGASGASGGVTVDLDPTFLGQVVLFLVLFLVLRPLLFQPMLKLFEEREKRIDGAKNEARAMFAQADAMMARYEEELVAVRRAAGEERDKLRLEGQRNEQAILAKVRAETNATVEEGRVRIAKEASSVRAELGTSAAEIAREMAARVLGRQV